MEIEVRVPKSIPNLEIDAVVELITAGNEVPRDGLRKRVLRCQHIVTTKVSGQTVGVSAIKAINPRYIKKLRIKAGYAKLPCDASEWGYSYVHPDWRRRSLYGSMLEAQSAKIATPTFATVRTANVVALSFLITHGWERVGETWKGRQGDVCLVILPNSFNISIIRRAWSFVTRLVS